MGDIGVQPMMHPQVAVVAGQPAAEAGLASGDVILAVNGEP